MVRVEGGGLLPGSSGANSQRSGLVSFLNIASMPLLFNGSTTYVAFISVISIIQWYHRLSLSLFFFGSQRVVILLFSGKVLHPCRRILQ